MPFVTLRRNMPLWLMRGGRTLNDDYSQFGEQKYILEAVAGCDPFKSRFFDVGAWHPTCFSNTRALWELGWSGVFVEPSPCCMMNLIKEYGTGSERSLLLQAIVHPCDDIPMPLHVTEDSVSTTQEANYDIWRTQTKFHGIVTVPSISVKRLLTWLGGKFDFLSIDTEGTSVELFGAFMEAGPRPRCICVEHDNRLVELIPRAERAGYCVEHVNGTNVVFARRKA